MHRVVRCRDLGRLTGMETKVSGGVVGGESEPVPVTPVAVESWHGDSVTSSPIARLHLNDPKRTPFGLAYSGGESEIYLEQGVNAPRVLKTPRRDNPNDSGVLVQRDSFVMGRLEALGITPAYLGPAATIEGRSGILLEYLPPPWGTLTEHIARREHDVPRDEAIELSGRLIEAVAMMHDAGIVHGDLKPSNVMVNPTTRALKLIDFSSAYLVGRPDHRAYLTFSGVYTDPRTLRAPFMPDMASDDYSTAVICFELLTGQQATLWFDLHAEKAKKTGVYPLYQRTRARHWLVRRELSALEEALRR